MRTIVPIYLILVLVSVSCKNEAFDPQNKCYSGTVIGKIRFAGGGPAISMDEPALSTHEWNGFKNVVEALNIPDSLRQSGKKVFLISRWPTESERYYVRTDDGDESAKPLIFVLAISTAKCPN